MTRENIPQKKFLLIEDDDSHAKIIRRLLHNQAIPSTMDRVSNGIEALKYLKRKAPYQSKSFPDVILLDLNLPGMNGFEFLSEFNRYKEFNFIPVIILTTSGAEKDKEKAYALNANSYLIKPSDPDEFKKLVIHLNLYWGKFNQSVSRDEDILYENSISR